jgi:hypothetical protein
MRRYSPIIAAGFVLLIGAITASTGAIQARLYGHDIFFLLDNGWRALCGQRVHVDYSSAWGPLTFLLVAAGLAVSGGSVAAVSYANAFAASVAGLWSVWLVAGRSRTMLAIVCPCFVALLIAAPFVIGESPTWTSHGMVYNRYGYALLMIIMLECFQPVADDRRARGREWIEPILTGCAVGLLLFLKITYFLIALPLLGASFGFRKPRGQRTLAHAVGFAGTALLFLAYLRFDVGAMSRDLLAAAVARSETLGIRHKFEHLLAAGLSGAALFGALTLWCRRACGPKASAQSLWRGWCYPLSAVLVVAADSLLLVTNAQALSYPLVAAFIMVLLLSLEPALPPYASASTTTQLLVLTLWFLTVPMIVLQGVGLSYAFIKSRANPDPPGVLRFESQRLHPLVLYDVAPYSVDRYSNGREYVAAIDDGIRLLAAHTRLQDKITTLDMFNPFSYALGREPIRGGIAAAAYRYTLDDRHHPSPARFFADAAVVMVPKQPASPPIFYDGYRKIYEPALAREFRLEAESSRWQLFRRTARYKRTSLTVRTAGAN